MVVSDWNDRTGSALRGDNPTALRRPSAGFAAIGDGQLLPGYSVLLVDGPQVRRLSELPRSSPEDRQDLAPAATGAPVTEPA